MPAGQKAQRATIHDVAARAGVSAATVSKVLRGVKTVKPENARRVREAVAALKFRIDPLAAGLRKDRRRIIAAVVPNLENQFFGALVTSLERAAEAAGYDVIIASSRENEAREADLIARMNDWRVAGTILAPVRSERGEGARVLRANGSTAVLVDRVSADDCYDTITADNFKASANVADWLVDAGHRHVLLYGEARISKAMRTRVQGFTRRALELAPQMRIDTLLGDGDAQMQRLAVREYFDGARAADQPTAVFSLSQCSTLIVLSEIRRRDIRCPGEISLIGFDDVEWMKATWPSISAVAQPVRAIAEKAIAVLLARVDGEAGFPVQHLELCDLRPRQSLGPARGAKIVRQETTTRTMPRR